MTDQPQKRVLWVATRETQEEIRSFLIPFGEEWEISVFNTIQDLSSALIRVNIRRGPQPPGLLIWGGDISDPILTDGKDTGLEELHEGISLMYYDHLDILPFYPEGQEEKNQQVFDLKDELGEIRSNLQIIDVLGDHPRQAIFVPEKMAQLNMALGILQGKGLEGPPASTVDPARR